MARASSDGVRSVVRRAGGLRNGISIRNRSCRRTRFWIACRRNGHSCRKWLATGRPTQIRRTPSMDVAVLSAFVLRRCAETTERPGYRDERSRRLDLSGGCVVQFAPASDSFRDYPANPTEFAASQRHPFRTTNSSLSCDRTVSQRRESRKSQKWRAPGFVPPPSRRFSRT